MLSLNICAIFIIFYNIAQTYIFRHLFREVKHRVTTYCNSIVNLYSPDEFKIHFRMKRGTAEVVYQHVSEVLITSPDSCLCDYIPGHEKQYVRL